MRSAKKKLKVTCDVAAYQALLDDNLLDGFDTNYKVNPPLREKRDNEALIKGIKDGTIDVICSGHIPHDDESKKIEFDLADPGMINLQTFASNLVSLSKSVPWDRLLEKVSIAPRRILGIEIPVIDVEMKANLTLFDPKFEWVLDEKTNLSKSRNSPWLGKTITGKAVAVFNNNKQWFDK
jgi:dihydroorotase